MCKRLETPVKERVSVLLIARIMYGCVDYPSDNGLEAHRKLRFNLDADKVVHGGIVDGGIVRLLLYERPPLISFWAKMSKCSIFEQNRPSPPMRVFLVENSSLA